MVNKLQIWFFKNIPLSSPDATTWGIRLITCALVLLVEQIAIAPQ